MTTAELLTKFHEIASNPRAQMDRYLAEGRRVILTAPVYTPEEIIHSMGMIPMGAWGADIRINEAKQYFPAFICSIMQSILELGMKGAYKGASAIVIPSLCDSLKCLGENWKYAVKDIPFIPMTYPQNRVPEFGHDFTHAGYARVIRDLEKITGESFSEQNLLASINVYKEHDCIMRDFASIAACHPELPASSRSDVFKSAFFIEKSEHTAIVRELIESLKNDEPGRFGIKVVTSGILADSPELLAIFDDLGMNIVADDVAAESRQYRTYSTAVDKSALDILADRFCSRDCCSVLYDPEKKRVKTVPAMAVEAGASGVIVILTKFCDPEEFDYPLIRKECDAVGMPCILVEVDRQMQNLEQVRTALQTFSEML